MLRIVSLMLWLSLSAISVSGLVAAFAGAKLMVGALGVSLEAAKFALVTHMERTGDRWGYIAIAVLIGVTSCEAYGFLAAQYSATTELDYLLTEQSKVESKLEHLPDEQVTKYFRLRKSTGIDERIRELLPDGRHPFHIVADFGRTSPDRVAKWFIFTLVIISEIMSARLIAASATFRPNDGHADWTGLSVETIMEVTGRKQRETVEAWLTDADRIPDKALRQLRRHLNEHRT